MENGYWLADGLPMGKLGFAPPIKLTLCSLALSSSICLAHADDLNAASIQTTEQAIPGKLIAVDVKNQHADWETRQTAKDLLRDTVESKNGDKLGSIKDLVINTRSGRVEYVIISSGGVAGIGTHLKAVPPSAISTATSKKNTLALDASLVQWNGAPKFYKKNLASLNDKTQAQRLYQYYKKSWPAFAVQTPATPALAPTGRDSGERGQNTARLKLASDLIGKHLINSQKQDVGKISDLLVDINGLKTAFVILKPGSTVIEANKDASHQLYAIPLNSLNTVASGRIVLDVTPAQFMEAQSFSTNSLGDDNALAGKANLYRYLAR